jgi:hypothetical protein
MFVDFNILNQLGSPSINSNVFVNRPSAGQVGRLFVSTDTFEIYRDNGTTWDLIGGPGSSTVTGTGAATQIAYWTSSQAIGGSNNLWWDNTNGFLGVKTNTPTAGTEVVQTDGVGVYANLTTVAGSGAGTTALLAKNTTNSSGYAAVIEERTPNVSAGQYPVLIRHTLSSGTAAANMATGIHFGLPDDGGTERINQFSMDTVDAAAATYSSRYRFLLRSNGAAVTPFYITGTGLGVFTATPGAALDIHSTGVIAQFNTTSGTGNVNIAFQRNGTGVWRIGDTYNGGNNYFELHNTVLNSNAIEVTAASNEALFVSAKTYTTGNAIGVAVRHNLTIPNGTNVGLAAIGGVNSNLNLSLGGSTTIANTGRQGLEGSTTISFTGAGTLTMTQGSTLRAFSALSTVYAFNGSAVGTITHLAGMRVCFPDNVGSAVNITNNYGILINNQTTGTGTVTYTNRWGIYQEGASDLNYFAGNTLIGTTTNVGAKIAMNGYMFISNRPLAQIVFNSTGTYYGQIQNDAADKWSFARNTVNDGTLGTAIMTWDASNNNVGIRNTSPINQLDLNNSGAPTLYDAGFNANVNGGEIELKYIAAGQSGGRTGSHIFYTGTTVGGTERIRITSTGNVGINTTTPQTKLDIFSGSNNTFASSIGNGLGIGNWSGLSFGYLESSNNFYRKSALVFERTGSSAEGNIHILLNNASDTSNATLSNSVVKIAAGGNFLIGTTTDNGNKVQVNGNVQNYANIGSNSVTVSALLTNYQILNSAYNGILVIRDNQAGGTDLWLIDPNLGTIKISGNIPKTYTITYSGGIYNINQSVGTVPVTYTTNVLGA